MKNQFKILCGAVALTMAGQVSAATDWSFTSSSNPSPTASAFNATAGGVTATARGYADTGPLTNPNSTAAGELAQQTSGYLYEYGGGLGINNFDGCATASGTCDVGDIASAAPEHAIDNQGRNEMVLLHFVDNQSADQKVNLTNVKFGWTGKSDTWTGKATNGSQSHSEYTIMAYTGIGDPGLAGKTSWGALGADWITIGNYQDASRNTNYSTTISNDTFNNTPKVGTFSSYWLIGAYNPLGSTVATNCYTPYVPATTSTPATKSTSIACTPGTSTTGDYLKLASVRGTIQTSNVPEPGSLALFGIALLGMLTLRKSQQA